MKITRPLTFLATTFFACSSFAVTLVDLTQQDFKSSKSADYQLVQLNKNTDKSGNTHIRYEQTYQGIPVYGYQIIEHQYAPTVKARGMALKKYTGTSVKGIEQDLSNHRLNATDSESTLNRLKANYARQHSVSLDQLQFKNEKARSVIFVDEQNKAHLAHEVNFYVDLLEEGMPSRPHYLVDTSSGKILKQWEGLATDQIGTGPGGNERIGMYYYGTDYPAFDVKVTNRKCTLKNDAGKTVDANNRRRRNSTKAYSYSCGSNGEQNDDTTNGAGSPLNDAHYFMQVNNQFYLDQYNTVPLPFSLVMRAHYGQNFANAFWDGSSMTYGDGNQDLYPFVLLDITAHELAHGVTENNSGLVYEGQPGGMNEAFSDMASQVIEYYVRGTNDWHLGAGIFKDLNRMGLRYMDNPPADGYSIDNASDYSDSLDVHYSSGVYNKAYYLLSTTDGWTTLTAFDVMYYANIAYWQPSSTFASGAVGVMQAAAALGRNVDDVVNAFSQVGIQCDKGALTCQ